MRLVVLTMNLFFFLILRPTPESDPQRSLKWFRLHPAVNLLFFFLLSTGEVLDASFAYIYIYFLSWSQQLQNGHGLLQNKTSMTGTRNGNTKEIFIYIYKLTFILRTITKSSFPKSILPSRPTTATSFSSFVQTQKISKYTNR